MVFKPRNPQGEATFRAAPPRELMRAVADLLSSPGQGSAGCRVPACLLPGKQKLRQLTTGFLQAPIFLTPTSSKGMRQAEAPQGLPLGCSWQYCSPYQSSSFSCRFSSPAKYAGLGRTHALEMTAPVEGDSELVQKERAPSPGDSGVLPPLFFPLHFQDINTLQMYWSGNNVSD